LINKIDILSDIFVFIIKMSEPYPPPCWKKFKSFTIWRIGINYDITSFEESECLCNSICVPYKGYALCINPQTRFDDPATRIIEAMNALDAEIAAKAMEDVMKRIEAAMKSIETAMKSIEAAFIAAKNAILAAFARPTTEDDLYAD